VDVLVGHVGVAPLRLDGFLAINDHRWHETFEPDLIPQSGGFVRPSRSCPKAAAV